MNTNTYFNRRNELRRLMSEKGASGHIVLFGNNYVPYNYKANPYDYFRQDSTFRYFFGLNEPGLVGVINIEKDMDDVLIGKEQTEDDIVWSGKQASLNELAHKAGVMFVIRDSIVPDYRQVHLLPAYRHDIKIAVRELFPDKKPSEDLIRSVVQMRSVKDAYEIAHMDKIQDVAVTMHTVARQMAVVGKPEREIFAEMLNIARSYGGNTSFPSIISRDGHILHNISQHNILQSGDLLVVDAGYESPEGYCTDHTRTWPIGVFSKEQKDVYDIVLTAKMEVQKNAAPGIFYKDMHLLAARIITTGLRAMDLMKGDIEEAVNAGAHALFFPHGLGHFMGMDVHDMEGLGENYVGYDETVERSDQFGLSYLRMARKLQEGFVVTDEPGIYFNPFLIDKWRSEGKFTQFINYEIVEKFKKFGGIRLEDDLLITSNGCRLLGNEQISFV